MKTLLFILISLTLKAQTIECFMYDFEQTGSVQLPAFIEITQDSVLIQQTLPLFNGQYSIASYKARVRGKQQFKNKTVYFLNQEDMMVVTDQYVQLQFSIYYGDKRKIFRSRLSRK